MKHSLPATLLATLLLVTNADAQTSCSVLSEPTARLACYDRAAKKQSKTDEFSAAKTSMLKKLADPESARWGEFFNARSSEFGPVVCGMVNTKNRMGGYDGMTGFIFIPIRNEAILLFSGREDPNASIATRSYREACLGDPRSDKRIAPPS